MVPATGALDAACYSRCDLSLLRQSVVYRHLSQRTPHELALIIQSTEECIHCRRNGDIDQRSLRNSIRIDGCCQRCRPSCPPDRATAFAWCGTQPRPQSKNPSAGQAPQDGGTDDGRHDLPRVRPTSDSAPNCMSTHLRLSALDNAQQSNGVPQARHALSVGTQRWHRCQRRPEPRRAARARRLESGSRRTSGQCDAMAVGDTRREDDERAQCETGSKALMRLESMRA